METKQLKPCIGPDCGKLLTSSNHSISNFTAYGNTIPYDVSMVGMNEGTYVISVVIHRQQCQEDGQAIQDGDYYNEDMEEFTIDTNTNDIEKDIFVVKLEHANGEAFSTTVSDSFA